MALDKSCFAYTETMKGKKVHSRTCTACEKMYCLRGVCPFFKPKIEEEKYLELTHGTTDIDSICDKYKPSSCE